MQDSADRWISRSRGLPWPDQKRAVATPPADQVPAFDDLSPFVASKFTGATAKISMKTMLCLRSKSITEGRFVPGQIPLRIPNGKGRVDLSICSAGDKARPV